MGRIGYAGSDVEIPIDDYVLAHLKVVIATKLRRSEGFFVTVPHNALDGRGRTAFWVAESVPIRIRFSGPDPADLDRNLIERLLNAANSNGGVWLDTDIAAHDGPKATRVPDRSPLATRR